MRKGIVINDKDDNKIECDILIEFVFDGNDYIVYTDNTLDSDGNFVLYKALLDNDRLCDPTDVDVDVVFDKLITDYKRKVLRGDI